MTRLIMLLLSVPLLVACQHSPALPPACDMKPESGRCRAAIERYWFDRASGSCRAFIWGGCDGVVPFTTLDDCQRSCGLLDDADASAAPVERPRVPRGY
jgi:hypothetical protein